MKNDFYLLEEILEGGYISPVFQPIVSLSNGNIFGYEALSRITKKELNMNIEQMFRTADSADKSWELESLCRKKALENAMRMKGDKKLFVNVNPNIIQDETFLEGVTKEHLKEYGLDSDNIIFEITERVAVVDNTLFLDSISHYKKQNYGIAIDDVGSGYSGLTIIADVRPNLIKLDMNLVRDIDKDETKQLLCKAIVDFCKHANVQLVAEGIETEEELKTLIKLNVDFGQGYFLAMPENNFEELTAEKNNLILKYHSKNFTDTMTSSFYPTLGYLSKSGHTFSPEIQADTVYEVLKHNPTITEFTIVENNIAIGFLTRSCLNEIFGGRYGYSLHAKKKIRQLMNPDFLRLNYTMPVDQVSRLAMQRSFKELYNPIVVEKEGNYLGIVTIKDLLDAYTKIEVDIAMHANPLTGLPGNQLIQKEILKRLFGAAPYCIIYYDIDNFKAYNDAYGFENGDLMLALVADILKECATQYEFIGHIGGDDFITICDYQEGELFCSQVVERFSERVNSLYRDADLNKGYIISKNRHGLTENFPIASLSIAGISNRERKYSDIDEFSRDIAHIKKKCKKKEGNYYKII